MNGPFEIREDPDNDRATIMFARQCHQARTRAHEESLSDVLEKCGAVACDVSNTEVLASDWLRWFERLTLRAARTGKTFAVVGMRPSVQKTTDDLALRDRLVAVGDLEEVWAL